MYDTYYWIFGESYNRWISAFLYPATRIIWALIIATTIWMCISGNGGLVNEFYSWKAFIPLSRLTYCVYLTHVWIDWYYWGSKRDLIDLNNLTYLILIICAILFISYIIGAIFSILFESPFFVLQKFFRDYFSNIQKSRIIFKSHNNNLDQKEIKNFILIDETKSKT
jgi:peptidoglycan/LPS O-acetylase OafA/YrhL